MADGGPACTEQTLRALVDVVTARGSDVPRRLSEAIAPFVAHDALLLLVAAPDGAVRSGWGDAAFVERAGFLDLDELRRVLRPGSSRAADLDVDGLVVPTLQVLSRNGALLVVARPQWTEGVDSTTTLLQIWNIVAVRVQDAADQASPGYLRLARASSGVRMEALADLADQYSTTLEAVLAALRSPTLGDRAARGVATNIAADGMVHLRTASDRALAFTEEPVTTAFRRLQDDLRPLVRFRDLDVQFVEPPRDGRPLPSEVAHGARAVVRGAVLALAERPGVSRVRVQWDCDGTNLLIALRDDGAGVLDEASSQLQLAQHRVRALGGALAIEATPGWGAQLSVVLPLDPPPASPEAATAWGLGPREIEVLNLVAAGRRNREIAGELGISENTVKFHVARVFAKLGVGNRAEATATYLAHQ